MEKINYQEFMDFLNSDKDEATYFGYSSDNLISLKERLKNLKERFEICERRIESDRNKIKEAYNNIDSIFYSNYYKRVTFNIGASSYYLKKEGNKYKVHFYASSEPSIFSNMKLNKYKNIGERFSKEIDNIIENSVKYFNKENIITSISSIFTLEDSYFTSLLTCNNIPFFYISKRTLMPDNHTIMPFYDEDTDRKIERMIVTEKQKLLTKIMIPNNY